MLLKKKELLKAGGFEAIKNSIVDDMDLCTNIKKSGGKVIFTDASKVSTCRMYIGKERLKAFQRISMKGLGERQLLFSEFSLCIISLSFHLWANLFLLEPY